MDATFQRYSQSVAAIIRLKFQKNASHVSFNGFFGKIKVVGDCQSDNPFREGYFVCQ
jgi:hypothetical protein